MSRGACRTITLFPKCRQLLISSLEHKITVIAGGRLPQGPIRDVLQNVPGQGGALRTFRLRRSRHHGVGRSSGHRQFFRGAVPRRLPRERRLLGEGQQPRRHQLPFQRHGV